MMSLVRRLGRFILNALMLLSLLACLTTLGLWWRGRHVKASMQFHARDSLYELASHQGRFFFDNEPQRTLEMESVRATLAGRVTEAYARAYEYYERSGRDLASEDHAEERRLFESEVDLAHRLADQIAERDAQVKRKWRLAPPVYRTVRCAPLAGVTAVGPILWLASAVAGRRRRALRQRANRCLACGYDLRASPVRCPECGTPVVPRPEVKTATPAGGSP